MKSAVPFILTSISLTWLGCQAPPDTSSPSADPALGNAKSAAIAAEPKSADEHKLDESCGDDKANAGSDEVRPGKDPKTGAEMQLVGAALAGVEVVTVKDLVANPDTYAGKTVRVEGDVNAMCHHRRGWFSVQDEGERAGTFVRVITAPSFLVPSGSIGKKARAEGKVDLVEVPAAAARHFAKDHKIGEKDVEGPVKSVVIRATGAEFI